MSFGERKPAGIWRDSGFSLGLNRAENSPSSGKEASDEVETETETEAEAVSGLASPGNGDQSPTKNPHLVQQSRRRRS